MSAARGVVTGSLGLTFLYAVISTREGAHNTGTFFDLLASLFRRLVDPAVPLIPDRR